MTDASLAIVGWREWLALPDLGLPAVRVKVDTGARSSSLHVERFAVFERGGASWVRFIVEPGDADHHDAACEAPIESRRAVTDSGGHSGERIFIRTRMRIGDVEAVIALNLTTRSNMLFPMLLGRTALAGRFQVDPARSFVYGKVRRGKRYKRPG